MKKNVNSRKVSYASSTSKEDDFPGYPIYPPNQDIYSRAIEELDIDPEDVTKLKSPNEKITSLNEKDFKDDVSGGDLDIPGSEDEDFPDNIGTEYE